MTGAGRVVGLFLVGAAVGVGGALVLRGSASSADVPVVVAPSVPTTAAVASPATPATGVAQAEAAVPTTAPPATVATASAAPFLAGPGPDAQGWVDPASVGAPYPGSVEGLLTFRGNPTRTFYGTGPVPSRPRVAWTYPGSEMCGPSSVGGETTTWCGSGWTGQPAVFERDGRTWVVLGAYDHAVHFVDAATGQDLLPEFRTGDIIKGSVTVDPDGFPLVYTGSRDNRYHVIAIDGEEPRELWALDADDASGPTLWNNDWDSSGLVLHDHLFVGGENSRWYAVRLNRAMAADGSVTVAPEVVFDAAGWDEELLGAIGDQNVSIESSVAISGDTLYFGNSGGLVQGWDLAALRRGEEPQRSFRFWAGDDTDGSVVLGPAGELYVGAEYERGTARADEVGQVIALDTTATGDPQRWGVPDRGPAVSGIWATPALHEDLLIAPTDTGRLLGIDRATGAVRWEHALPGPLWSSPAVVDDVLIQGDCNGVLHGFDLSQTDRLPRELWSVELGGCIESTPAVWDGGIYVATRAGLLHALR